jgi:hypothetical protein
MIELDKKFNPQNGGTELDDNLLKSLPLPVYDAFKLIEKQTDYEKSLQILCLSLIPWTYQYIALMLSGEYLASEHEPSFEVTDSLVNMVKKPGPGKWIGFTRAAASYFMDHKTNVISHEAISALNTVLNGKDRPQVKLLENGNKLEYSDALINIRNRFAHSRNFSAEKAQELFQDYFQIWKAWIIIIKDVFEPKLLFRSSPDNPFQSFDNRPLNIKNIPADQEKGTPLLWDEKKETLIRLYPIIVTNSEDSKPQGEVAFLEEIKSKYLFYLHGDNFFKLRDEFDVLSKMIESKTIIEEVVTAESLTIKAFAERIDRITNQTISDFQDALKYIPEMYIDRPAITVNLDKWLESNLPGCIITGNPGTGKTSIITNWCLRRKAKGDHVLLLEASRFRESDVTMIIEKELNLASPLKDCLDTIQNQNKNSTGEQAPQKFIIVIDAVNEFTGKDNENRSRLWREINSLVSSLNLYSPYLKCLVTTRNDLWNVDFPGKNTAADMLKEKFYWGEAGNDFPRVFLGNFSVAEAGEIFENARTTIPSMEVQTSFSELSEKTKKVLCNPFILRLALLTFNGREMGDLTKSKIENQYTREKITEEKDKKAVLFALLERMSELRKTEVTFDEFLYTGSKIKSKKKVSEKDRINLEKLIFDPRPQSPYKKLIKEGILEEKADDSNIESKEQIRFSQEKITDIIYSEFQKRGVKKLIILAIFGFVLLLVILGVKAFFAGDSIKSHLGIIQTELNNSTLSQGSKIQIGSISAGIIKRTVNTRYILSGVSMFVCYAFFVIFIFVASYFRISLSKRFKNDLSTRFIKEKFVELVQKKIPYLLILIILLPFIYVFWISSHPHLSQSEILNPVLYGFPVFLLFSILWILILHAIVVLKNANSPQDAFCVFGKKEFIHSCIELIYLIPFLILMYFGITHLSDFLNIDSDKELIALKQEWFSNADLITMKITDIEHYNIINSEILDFTTDKEDLFKPFLLSFSKVMIYSLCILFPLMLLLQYFAGFWLFKLLKKRL